MSDEWLSAAETLRLVEATMGKYDAQIAISTRAHDGLIQTKADRFVNGPQVIDNVELPKEFWWACGHEALEQNWISGDFATWIKQKDYWKAYGVTFLRHQVEKMVPSPSYENLDQPDKPRKWVPAYEAVMMVSRATMQGHAKVLSSIITCAQAGQIKGRAANINETTRDASSVKETIHSNTFIPLWFWKDCTDPVTSKFDWQLGIFKGFRSLNRQRSEVTLIGVEFEAEGLLLLAPSVQPQIDALAKQQMPNAAVTVGANDAAIESPQLQSKGGRPLSKLWPDWVAEFAMYIHEEGFPQGEGQQGQDEIITAVADRLASRGLESPSRTTIQPALQAVLHRLRSAGN